MSVCLIFFFLIKLACLLRSFTLYPHFPPSEFVCSCTGQRRWAGEFEPSKTFPREASSASKKDGKKRVCWHHSRLLWCEKLSVYRINLYFCTDMSESWSQMQKQMLERTIPTCLTWTTRWTFSKCVCKKNKKTSCRENRKIIAPLCFLFSV